MCIRDSVKRIPDGNIVLRGKGKSLFHVKRDIFLEWLGAYPIKVYKTGGGTRALSPANDNTILGKKLRKKWEMSFNDPNDEDKALRVLKAEVEMRRKSNDLEFMVEATRWLNQGFYQKYEYLLEESTDSSNGIIYDNSEDWE